MEDHYQFNLNNWKIVGISGVTCGGKSSLCNSLLQEFKGSVLVCQDDFFYDKFSDRHVMIPELNHQNWECLESIDWEAMMVKIKEMTSQPPPCQESLFIIEGHIIYNYPPLEKLFHVKYFFTLPESECFKRRSNRVYDPPDPEGYFEECVWPMYCSNMEAVQKNSKSVVYLDGTENMTIIKEKVINQLRPILRNGNSNILD